MAIGANEKVRIGIVGCGGIANGKHMPNLKKLDDKLGYVGKITEVNIQPVLDVLDKYPFSSNERELILSVKEALEHNNLDPYTLYKYGLYANSVAGEIKGLDIKDITESYNNLVIQSKKDIDISSEEIMRVLNKEPGSYLKDIYLDIEKEILYRRLSNEKDRICEYILNKY